MVGSGDMLFVREAGFSSVGLFPKNCRANFLDTRIL